jgi:anaerobic selenocysteine-containing dehydrogenase
MMNAADITAQGFADGDIVDICSVAQDGIERCVQGFRITAYDIPAGNCAAYYPETNALVPLASHGDRSYTPTSKAIPVVLRKGTE